MSTRLKVTTMIAAQMFIVMMNCTTYHILEEVKEVSFFATMLNVKYIKIIQVSHPGKSSRSNKPTMILAFLIIKWNAICVPMCGTLTAGPVCVVDYFDS
jgi:hypothetical protein